MIHLILGTMFAGKSTELLKYLRRGCFARKKVCLLSPEIDNRGYLTHNEEKLYKGVDFFQFPQASHHIKETLDSVLEYDTIGIDEYQFFSLDYWAKWIYPFLNTVQELGKDCYIAGLSGTFLLTPFEIMALTIPLANKIQLENAICKECGSIAYYTHRCDGSMVTDLLTQNIGSEEMYIPLCWPCWQKLSKNGSNKK